MMLVTVLLVVLVLLVVFQMVMLLRMQRTGRREDIDRSLHEAMEGLKRLQQDEFARNRQEQRQVLGDFRAELGRLLMENRQELGTAIKSFEETLSGDAREQSRLLREQFARLMETQERIRSETSDRLDSVRGTVEARLERLQEQNALKLEEMRLTVDEKLQETLEKRLSDSFRQVSERLQKVHEGLGEMKHLATGVGDLKKVLSNVKTRGILGEMQLQNILSSLLSPEQYEENVAVRDGSRERVEFAIRLPGRDEEGEPVYLPLDAKFPMEAYYRLVDASESGNGEALKQASKEIEIEMKRCAKEISEKYLNPPRTTDFGLLFLPVEGLFAEVVRNTSLLEMLQRDYSIVVTGPTTLAALLNSLQMGFRTLAIERRTGEVWKVLAQVKREFGRFGEVLDRAQNRLTQASSEIDRLVGVRTRSIQRSLKGIDEGERDVLEEGGRSEG
ncbi:DNA recombination protein RmuC [Prosthecochloris ethylica]|nr:DNA recombination protein RmuC [Prosthecochloris ethylica]